MTIKQALKLKNTLVKQTKEEMAKLHSYNSIEESNNRPYSAKETLDKINQLTKELIDLKTSIHTANLPVYADIFEMSELKNLVVNLRSLDCSEGKTYDRYGRNSEPVVKTAEISIVERDEQVKLLEERIEKIQEKLDQHNSTTHI